MAFPGINKLRVINTLNSSTPAASTNSLLSIVYGQILISYNSICRYWFSAGFLSRFFFSPITNQSNDRLFLARIAGRMDAPFSQCRETLDLRQENYCRSSRSQFPRYEIVLRRNAERVRDAIEESEQGCDVDGLGYLAFLPSCKAQLLDILGSGSVSSLSDQFHVSQQRALRRRKVCLVKLAFDDCLHTLIGCSLNTQEVGMAVQSIRAPVQIRDVAGDHFFVSTRKMSLREMDRVSRSIIRRRKSGRDPKHLMIAGYLQSSRACTPKVVSRSGFSGGLSIFDDPDLRGRLLCLSIVTAS